MVLGDAQHRSAGGNDLTRLSQDSGDNAVIVGDEASVRKLVGGQFKRATRTIQPALRLGGR